VTDPKVLMACPTWSGCLYSLKPWAEAYHATEYANKGALQVDNSDGPQSGGNLHYVHTIRGHDIPAVWQHTRWPALWDTLELSWRIIVEHAREHGYDFIFSVEADVIVPPEAMRKMVDCALENAVGGKPAVVSQRYHPRGQPGPNFYWDTLGCTLFPVEPLWQDRDLVKAIFEIDCFIECQRHGHPRYRPGHDGPDLFEVQHLKDPDDSHKAVYGAQPAPTAYMKRVMAANGLKMEGDRAVPVVSAVDEMMKAQEHPLPMEPAVAICGEPAAVDVHQAELREVPGIDVSDALIKRQYPDTFPPNAHGQIPKDVSVDEFTDLITKMSPGDGKEEIPIGTAHLEAEPPPPGANVDRPYGGRREGADGEKAAAIDDVLGDRELVEKVLAEDRIRLNVGSDRVQIAGFLSVDFNPDVDPDVLAEATDLSMFADDSVDEVYASHVLEHLSWKDGLKALKEWKRVLKPGAVLTVACPDVMQVYLMYKHGATWGDYGQQVNDTYVQASAFGANLLVEEIPEMKDQYGGPGHAHHSIYILDMLLNRVIEAGFVYCHEVTACFLRKAGMGETMVQARKLQEGEE
jgi:SAM-dependent methyltransferase